jgi:glycosyltransferase involved in cell wall biosynthesis
MSSLRVVIAAEHASTSLGGEAILPYHYFRGLRARGVDAFLIVHERTRTELLTLFPTELDRICFVPDKLLQKIFFRCGRLLPRRVSEATFGLASQWLTQLSQRAIVRSLASFGSVVHQPIPVSPRFPSLLFNVGSPVIIGPMNGGMEFPPAFQNTEPLLSRLSIPLGRAFAGVMNSLLPGKKRAAALLVANRRTRAALPSGMRGQVFEISENGVDLARFHAESSSPTPGRFVFIGRLVTWKALDIVFHALVQTPQATLDVVGDGPMLPRWQKLVAALGLQDRVTFHGWLPQTECADILARSTALVLPSLYECGGAVVLEAMAMATPVIATAWGGPADYVDDSCGILIDPTSRKSLVNGFAAAMQRLMLAPEIARTLGAAGSQKVRAQFDWEKKIDAMLEIYASLVPPETVLLASLPIDNAGI